MKTPQSPAPVAAKTFSVGDYAVRLEDHPLVKAGEVHQVVEMFRGGYLGFAKPIGGEWNPKGWRKCDAEGWMPWSGGENPVPGQRVDYRMSNGHVGNGWHADNLRWTNEVPEHRIIAFRLSRPASDQPVEAIGAGRRELLERLEAEVSDETMRALLSCKDVGSGRAHLARILAALSPAQSVEAIGAGREEGGSFLLMKRGLYYRPNAQGYTGTKDYAGRYTAKEAADHSDPISGVTAIAETEAPEFSPQCYDDQARAHLSKKLAEAEAKIAALSPASPARGEAVAWRRRPLNPSTGSGAAWVLYGPEEAQHYNSATDRYEIEALGVLFASPAQEEAEDGYGPDPHHTKETSEDKRLMAAGYKVCGSGANTQWHWMEPNGVWHDHDERGRCYRQEHVAAKAALAHLAALSPASPARTPMGAVSGEDLLAISKLVGECAGNTAFDAWQRIKAALAGGGCAPTPMGEGSAK